MSMVSSGQLAMGTGLGQPGMGGEEKKESETIFGFKILCLVPVATVQFRANKLIVTLSACIMHHVLLS